MDPRNLGKIDRESDVQEGVTIRLPERVWPSTKDQSSQMSVGEPFLLFPFVLLTCRTCGHIICDVISHFWPPKMLTYSLFCSVYSWVA